jgi:MYXO-CTERM domain-containing protein
VSCQEKCQESSYAQCRSELSSDCTTQCNSSGAIFCNGAYVNASDVDTCVSALNEILTSKISITATGSCSGDECSGKGSVSCATAAPGTDSSNGSLWAIFAAMGVALVGGARRERRRGH